MNLGCRQVQRMEQKFSIGDLRPLCHIVHLFESREGDYGASDVREALGDFNFKHPGDSIHSRVSYLYEGESLNKPSKYFSYWLIVNPNAVRLASFCLEKEVSEGDVEAIGAGLALANNLIRVYKESITVFREKSRGTKRESANQKADEIFSVLKGAIKKNHDYLTQNDSYSYLPVIDQVLKEIEEAK